MPSADLSGRYTMRGATAGGGKIGREGERWKVHIYCIWDFA